MIPLLITGANGQLGSEFRQLAPVYKDFCFIFTDIDELDITDYAQLEKFIHECKPSVIVNCAGYTAVDMAEEQRELAWLLNGTAVGYMAQIASLTNSLFVHISTDYVFNGLLSRPYIETDVGTPVSYYAETKLEGERQVLMFSRRSVIIRTSWLYSAYGRNFVKTMLKLGQEQNQVRVVNDQTGTPTYARDLAATILKIIPFCQKEENSIYHYSNEGVATWYDFALEVMALGKRRCAVIPVKSIDYPALAKRPSFSVLNKDKIKQDFGLEIPHWKESLKECVDKIKEGGGEVRVKISE